MIPRRVCSLITMTRIGEVATTDALRRVWPTIPISPMKSPGPSSRDAFVPADHVGGPLDDHEELVCELALAHERLALRDVDLVGLARDQLALPARKRCEQGDPLDLGFVHSELLRSLVGRYSHGAGTGGNPDP